MNVGAVRIMVKVHDLDGEANFWTKQLAREIVRFDGAFMVEVGDTTVEFVGEKGTETLTFGLGLQISGLYPHWHRLRSHPALRSGLQTNEGYRSFSLRAPSGIEVTLFEPTPPPLP